LVSLVAFEGLALTTLAPTMSRELGGGSLYGLIFSVFFLLQMVGALVTGRQADRRGLATPFALSIMLFGAGLLVAGLSPNMGALIAARALQGWGAGGFTTSVYATINLCYPDSLRPRMLAALSSAWVLPALVGPAAAGYVADTVGWRAVFLGLLPLAPMAWVLLSPSLKRMTVDTAPSTQSAVLPYALGLSAGTGMLIWGMQAGSLPGISLSAGGLLVIAPCVRRVVPHGPSVARSLPAIVAARGLFVAAFFCAEAFLALALNSVGGYSASTAGLVISAGSLSWSFGSWLQSRLDGRLGARGRRTRVRIGIALVALGIAIISAALITGAGTMLALALPGWLCAGLGIGMAHSTSSALTFFLAPAGREGEVSSSLQLADAALPALAIAAGGVLANTNVLYAFILGFSCAAGAFTASLFVTKQT
jgi:MFS family permease